MRTALAVLVSMVTFAAAAVGLALLFVPTRDLRAAVAYLVTLIAVANIWATSQCHGRKNDVKDT